MLWSLATICGRNRQERRQPRAPCVEPDRLELYEGPRIALHPGVSRLGLLFTASDRKRSYILSSFTGAFFKLHFVAEIDKKGANPEPRVSNPIALNYTKALASRYIWVYRVLDFY